MFRQNKIASTGLLIVILCLGWTELSGEELTGQEILNKVDQNATPNTQIMTAEMTIINRLGAKRIRKVKIWMKGDDYTLANSFIRLISKEQVSYPQKTTNGSIFLYSEGLDELHRKREMKALWVVISVMMTLLEAR